MVSESNLRGPNNAMSVRVATERALESPSPLRPLLYTHQNLCRTLSSNNRTFSVAFQQLLPSSADNTHALKGIDRERRVDWYRAERFEVASTPNMRSARGGRETRGGKLAERRGREEQGKRGASLAGKKRKNFIYIYHVTKALMCSHSLTRPTSCIIRTECLSSKSLSLSSFQFQD